MQKKPKTVKDLLLFLPWKVYIKGWNNEDEKGETIKDEKVELR